MIFPRLTQVVSTPHGSARQGKQFFEKKRLKSISQSPRCLKIVSIVSSNNYHYCIVPWLSRLMFRF